MAKHSEAPLTRRAVVGALVAAAPASLLQAQEASPVPPKGVPQVPPSGSVQDDLQKALAAVKQVSAQLAGIAVPMDLEPAFTFHP